jgi:pimeloyl-ACP methyl ester carboxylesterase
MHAGAVVNQHIQYATSSDGLRIAYAVMGKGTPVVRAPHWLTHLEYELDSPVWRHLILGMASRHKLIRYDGRGTGLSQRDAVDISMDRWVSDLECVVDTLALERFVLLGVSQGGAISVEYAARHPERVSHLIIHGAYARGFLHRENPDKQRQFVELNRALVREGWGSEHDTYRQWFTSQFIPGGTAEQSRWFNDLERVSATPEMMERFVVELSNINVAGFLPKVKAPTLVTHCKGDVRVPFALGQEIAAGIPGAKFVPLDSPNHLFLADEPATRVFFDAVNYLVSRRSPVQRSVTGDGDLQGASAAAHCSTRAKLDHQDGCDLGRPRRRLDFIPATFSLASSVTPSRHAGFGRLAT